MRSPGETPPSLAARRIAAAPAVELSRVSKRWPRRLWPPGARQPAADVLVDVNLRVRSGEIVALLGQNGAGKTTLLKIVAGLARPDSGDVRVFGGNGISPSPELRRRVAYAGAERGFYFRLTVRENLAFFGALDGLHPRDRARRIGTVAELLDITSALDVRFADLSTGMRQRLSVARALLSEPDVFLLDEPTRALDPPHAAELRRFVRETLVERQGKTVLVATNLIDEARALGDRVAVLRATRLAFLDLTAARFDDAGIRRLYGVGDDD